MSQRSLKLLGEFTLLIDGSKVDIPGKKKKALIAMVALAPGRTVSRRRLSETLWSDRSHEQAMNSLRQTLAELRRLLQPVAAELLTTPTRGMLHLDLAEEDIDCLRLRLVARSHSISDKSHGVDLYDGELLEGLSLTDPVFEDYIQIERVSYRSLYQDMLHSVTSARLDEGNFEAARNIAAQLLQLDQGDEAAHRDMIRAYLGMGDKTNALRQYQTCERYLAAEFRAEPSSATKQLREQLMVDRPPNRVVVAESETSHPQINVGVSLFAFRPNDENTEETTHDFCATIASALTQFRWLSIHPTRATFKHSSSGMDAVEIGHRLNIGYMIDGQLSLRDSQARVNVELVDVPRRTSVWADRFSGASGRDDLFSTEILGAIVSRLDVRIRFNEINRVLGSNTSNLDAYSCVLNAIHEMHQMTADAYDRAWSLLTRAERLDPDFSDIYSWKAFWCIFSLGQGFCRDSKQEMESASEYSHRALGINPEDALALAILGHAEAFLNHDFGAAVHYFDRSLKLNPHSSFAWMLSTATYAYLGNPQEALRRLDHSQRLCPIEPHYELLYNMARTVASFVGSDYQALTYWGEKTIRENDSFTNGYKLLIAGLGHQGRIDDARKYINRLLVLEPEFTVESFVLAYPLARESDKARLRTDLIKAGAPTQSGAYGAS